MVLQEPLEMLVGVRIEAKTVTGDGAGIQLLLQGLFCGMGTLFFVVGPVSDVTGIGTVTGIQAAAALLVGDARRRGALGMVTEVDVAHGIDSYQHTIARQFFMPQ